MSDIYTDKYEEFFLNCNTSVVLYDTFELSHNQLTMTYYLVRNCALGLTATTEKSETIYFHYYPLKIAKGSSSTANLDQSIDLQMGDLGTVLPPEIDRILSSITTDKKPVLIQRGYRSDDLTSPTYGPVTYKIDSVTYNSEGCKLTATAPQININKTGESYTVERFPMLKATL